MPFREWFADGLGPRARELYESSRLVKALFNEGAVRQALETSARPQSAMLLWPVTNLCLWEQSAGATLS